MRFIFAGAVEKTWDVGFEYDSRERKDELTACREQRSVNSQQRSESSERAGGGGMENLVLRQFRRGDGVRVQAMARTAWRHTYKGIFHAEFIDQFVATNYAPESLESLVALVEAGSMFFCVAVVQEVMVGFSNIWDRW